MGNCCKPKDYCDSSIPESCEPLQQATEGNFVVIEDQQGCKRTLQSPDDNALIQYIDGKIVFRKGSSTSEINLPELLTNTSADVQVMLGVDSNGNLKIIQPVGSSALVYWDGTKWESVDPGDVFASGNGILVRDVSGPQAGIARWITGNVGDSIIVDSGGNVVFAGPGSFLWSIKVVNYSPLVGENVFVNTTGGAITIGLPTPVALGATIKLADPKGTWKTNNVTVNPNGENIQGSVANLILDVNWAYVELVYVDALTGWTINASK